MLKILIKKKTVITCAIIIFASIFIQLNSTINPNSGWHLYVAGKLLSGKKLYADIIEINFPFIYYFRIIPHLVQQYTGISNINASIWINIAINMLGFLTTVNLLKYTPYEKSPLYKNAIITGLCFGMFILPCDFTQTLFGEKEQLITAMLMPYIFTGIAGREYYTMAKYKRFAIALFAALGICIKPVYALVFVVVEIYIMLRNESSISFWQKAKERLTESLAITIIGLIYIYFIFTVTPEFFVISKLTKFFYSPDPWYFFFIMPFTSIHALLMLFVVVTWQSCKQYKTQEYLLVIFLTCVAAASMHLKANDYYFYPAMVFAVLLFSRQIACFFVELADALKSSDKISKLDAMDYSNFMATLFVVPYLIFICFLGITNLLQNQVMDDYCGFAKLKQYIESFGERKKVAIFGNLPEAFPLINYTNSEYSLRYSGVWLPCGIASYRLSSKSISPELEEIIKRTENFYVQGITEDLIKNNPDIIIINTDSSAGCGGLDDFSKRYPDLAGVWRNYSLTTTIGSGKEKASNYDIYLKNRT